MGSKAQFFVDSPCSEGESVPLNERDTHHALHVLRLQNDAEVRVVSIPQRAAFSATLRRVGKEARVTIAVRESIEFTEPIVSTLLFGLSKGKKNEVVVEKATELGVAHVILCEMSRSISKFKGDGDLKSKTEKYSQVAEAAAKQSKRLDVPRITVCQKIEQAIELLNFESGQRFCCSLSSSAIPIQEISLQKRGQVLAVGPEGDFSPEEEQKLCESQFELVSLGTNVLRSETAAIAAIAMTQARYSED